MDDLNGLDWTTSSSDNVASKPVYPSLRPSPAPSSGRSTPSAFRPPAQNLSQASLKIGSKPVTPANDSFASLLSGGKQKASSSLSLQERQRQLLEERNKKAQELDKHFGQLDPAPLPLKSNVAHTDSASILPIRQLQHAPSASATKDDILKAVSSSYKVDSTSHFPPASQPISRNGTPLSLLSDQPVAASFDDDDDPFDLGAMAAKSQSRAVANGQDDDTDILGMLGKPVEQVSSKPVHQAPPQTVSSDDDVPTSVEDKAVAELVDMGFTADKAAIALAQTDSGHDVRAAVGILLNQAHGEARQKAKSSTARDKPVFESDGDSWSKTGAKAAPSWLRHGDESRASSQARNQSSSEKDVAKMASDLGNTLFKSANSLWKTSQKKVQKAMAELQQDGGDSNQPKWMRNAADVANVQERSSDNVTDEAAMLESRPTRSAVQSREVDDRSLRNGTQYDVALAADQTRSTLKSSAQNGLPNSRMARVTREELEQATPEAYVSPARRRKPQTSAPDVALRTIESSSAMSNSSQSNNPFANVVHKPPKSQTQSVVRPKASQRTIPPASPSAISSAAQQRQKGTDAFKRGDYATAHAAYSSALRPLPQGHPISIVIFCNRALTSLKNGDPKAAISDAESALAIIGVARGDGEKIDLGVSEGSKEMKEFYGKALMRKAEALENMERWADAGKAWRDAVEGGIGGPISIQGRNRCEKATMGGNKPAPAVKAAAKPKPPIRRPVTNPAASQEAVKKLRQANAAAERADDEKFALTDHVDAKLLAWKGSKADNLRALLGSLDKVLWPEAGWKKVGMADLVMANRVKIVYMKAIAKVHPDKVAQTATTEQKMLSAAVFSTLNEAWDKFKQENNM